uniref:Uncharacterized protein n=2 Tax=Clastoptera arizonana TaxID=38151 RepID=A0A1B6CEG9_9HEMI
MVFYWLPLNYIMGASLAKELGLYNEEEIILQIAPESNSTPIGHHFRILNSDPRSATQGINRTPILVECTPKTKVPITGLSLDFKQHDNSLLSQEEDLTEKKNENEEKIVKPKYDLNKPIKKYLETDIDADQNISPITDIPLLKHPRILTLSSDPWSPTSFEGTRSPVQVECSPSMFSLCSKIDRASFDFDITNSSLEDPSAIVSDIDDSCSIPASKQPEEFKEWFETLEKVTLSSPSETSPKKTPIKSADRNLKKKQLFLTPDNKKGKLKARTPLGNLQNNQLIISPKKILREKHWRGIEEERTRRGVKLEDENTPPSLPPLSKISSAPGKIIRKRNLEDWDNDTTMFI